jgi:hypothetical protein
MPIPAAPVGRCDVGSTVLKLFEQLHDQVRQEIEGLDDAALNWSPGPGANSIATLVTHLVGSEGETLRGVAGVAAVRDRDEEFVGATRSVEEIRNELRAADELIEALRSEVGGQRLRVMLALPSLPADERRSGLTWLIGNYGHAREHVGHLQLTKQLYQAHSDGL